MIKKFDFYSNPIKIHLKGHYDIKTTIGGISSIMTFILMIVHTYFNGIDIILRSSPKTYQETITLNHSNEFNITDSPIFYFNIFKGDRTPFYDPTYIKFRLVNKLIENSKLTNLTEYKIERCSTDLLKKNPYITAYQSLLDIIKRKNYLCPIIPQELIIKGSWIEQNIKYFQILVYPCNPETDNVKCKSKTEIDDFIWKERIYFSLYYPLLSVYLNNYESPFGIAYKEDYFYLPKTDSYIFHTYELEKVLIKTDSGVMFPLWNEDLGMKMKLTSIDISNIRITDPYFFSIDVISSFTQIYYERSYIKLLDIFSNCGGIIQFLWIIFIPFVSYFVKIEQSKFMINKIFSYKNPEGKNDEEFQELKILNQFFYSMDLLKEKMKERNIMNNKYISLRIKRFLMKYNQDYNLKKETNFYFIVKELNEILDEIEENNPKKYNLTDVDENLDFNENFYDGKFSLNFDNEFNIKKTKLNYNKSIKFTSLFDDVEKLKNKNNHNCLDLNFNRSKILVKKNSVLVNRENNKSPIEKYDLLPNFKIIKKKKCSKNENNLQFIHEISDSYKFLDTNNPKYTIDLEVDRSVNDERESIKETLNKRGLRIKTNLLVNKNEEQKYNFRCEDTSKNFLFHNLKDMINKNNVIKDKKLDYIDQTYPQYFPKEKRCEKNSKDLSYFEKDLEMTMVNYGITEYNPEMDGSFFHKKFLRSAKMNTNIEDKQDIKTTHSKKINKIYEFLSPDFKQSKYLKMYVSKLIQFKSNHDKLDISYWQKFIYNFFLCSKIYKKHNNQTERLFFLLYEYNKKIENYFDYSKVMDNIEEMKILKEILLEDHHKNIIGVLKKQTITIKNNNEENNSVEKFFKKNSNLKLSELEQSINTLFLNIDKNNNSIDKNLLDIIRRNQNI